MLKVKRAADVVEEKIEWLWKPLIPFGKITMIQGDTGVGKTSFLVKIIADLSRGLYPPGIEKGVLSDRDKGEPLKTFYVTSENDEADTLVPAYKFFGGDIDNLLLQDSEEDFELTKEEVRQAITETGAGVVIVDPWAEFLPPDIDSGKNVEIRRLLRDIQKVAGETGAAIIFTNNYTKSTGQTGVFKGLGGSALFTRLRCIMTVSEDKDGRRFIRSDKMSVGRERETGPIEIVYDEEGMIDFAGVENIAVRNVSRAEEARLFLKEQLENGGVDSKEIKRLANERGISMTTINRVKSSVGVKSKEMPDRSSVWYLAG